MILSNKYNLHLQQLVKLFKESGVIYKLIICPKNILNYLVIGICIFLLFAVIYFSIKPISMGIEARRNLKDTSPEDIDEITNNFQEKLENENGDKTYISEEIVS